MRVLLTGATGFLGSRVLALLHGDDVLCLSRDPRRVPDLPGVRAIASSLDHDGEWVETVSRFRPELCLHLAWDGLPDYSLGRCRLNIDASLRLIDAASKAGVKRVVVAGSCWEYGKASGAVTEGVEPSSVGVFAAAKLALLRVFDSVARDRGFEYAWARVFFVYGPGQRPTSLIPHLRESYAAGREPQVRRPEAVEDFVHIDDVAAALVALGVANAPSGVFNVGSGQPTCVRDVANRVAEYYRMPPLFAATRPAGGFWADTDKIHASTGWHARIGIDEGIARTLAALDRG